MARFTGGWFPTPRIWLDLDPSLSPFADPKHALHWLVFSRLCSWACIVPTGRCGIGECLISVKSLATAHGVSKARMQRILGKLKKWRCIDTRIEKAERKSDTQNDTPSDTPSDTACTVVIILDYCKIKKVGPAADTPSDTASDTQNGPVLKNGERIRKKFPPKPPHGGAREKPNLRSLRRQPAPCSCSDSGTVPIRRLGDDGQWEDNYAGCPDCPKGVGRWAIADAIKYGWELSKSQK